VLCDSMCANARTPADAQGTRGNVTGAPNGIYWPVQFVRTSEKPLEAATQFPGRTLLGSPKRTNTGFSAPGTGLRRGM
jgi:hypothetical protein